MGYSKLRYEDFIENPEYYFHELNLNIPQWSQEISDLGYEGVWAVDFYEDLFEEHLETSCIPEDYQTGNYGAIALEIFDTFTKDKKGHSKRKVHRITVTEGCMELYDMIDRSDNFVSIAPVAYAGKQRTNENARFLFALCVEIDDINPEHGIDEMFYAFRRENRPVPKPTYVVCSGNGVHLYYVFERPIPLFKNIFMQFTETKNYMTTQLWSAQISNAHDKIQYESVCQAFRAVGTSGKDKNKIALAFKTGPKLSIEDFNARLPKKYAINKIYKSDLPLKKAKELYPEWYQKRVIEKRERGHWYRHEGIYYDWIKKCYKSTKVNHRYYCLENLCSLAVQCCIDPEQLEKDVRRLAEHFETLTDNDKNHFTEYDVICAMRTYQEPSEMAFRRRIEFISTRTNIPLTPNKRNGRTRAEHIKIMNFIRDEINNNVNWREGNGRKTKVDVVRKWIYDNPNGTKADCIRETGLSKMTVYKWWNKDENED